MACAVHALSKSEGIRVDANVGWGMVSEVEKLGESINTSLIVDSDVSRACEAYCEDCAECFGAGATVALSP